MKISFSVVTAVAIFLVVCISYHVEGKDLKCYSCVYGDKSSASEFGDDEHSKLLFHDSCGDGKRPKSKFVKTCNSTTTMGCGKIYVEFNNNHVTIRDCLPEIPSLPNQCSSTRLQLIRNRTDIKDKLNLLKDAPNSLQINVCSCEKDICNSGSLFGISKQVLVTGILITTFLGVIF